MLSCSHAFREPHATIPGRRSPLPAARHLAAKTFFVLAGVFCLALSSQGGCQRTTPMPSNVVNVERDADGKITSLHIAHCGIDNASAISRWLDIQAAELQSLTLESCDVNDAVANSLGMLDGLKALKVWNSAGWIRRLAGPARNVESIAISDLGFRKPTLRALQEFDTLQELVLIAKTEELELQDVTFENLDFLTSLSIERLEIVARSVAVKNHEGSEQLQSLQSLSIIADAEASDVTAFSGSSPLQSFSWTRVISESCAAPLSSRFADAGNWSKLRGIRLSVNPEKTWSEWHDNCGSECPSVVKIYLGRNFAEALDESQQVRQVTLAHVTMTEKVWIALANLPNLSSLEIDCCDITDSDLRHLIHSTSLSFLRIGRGSVNVTKRTRAKLEESVGVVVWSERRR